jgi:hypothetical protein
MAAKPNDVTNEDWEKTWNNSSYVLQPLADVLKNMKKDLGKVSPTDFSTPNHYVALVSELVQIQLIDKVLALLPATVDK